MKTTAPSTAADDRDRERREGSVLWAKTKPLLDELQRLQALEAQQPDADKAAAKKAKKARAAHAREVRTARLYAAIDAAVEVHRLQLTAWTGSDRSRAEWLQRQIANNDARPPSWRYICDYLKTLHF